MRFAPLVLLLALALVAPTAAAAPGWATRCSDLDTGACATAVLTPTLLGCATVDGAWRCDVLWTLDLAVTGPTCAWAYSEVARELLLCAAVASATTSTFGVKRYDVPAGGSTATEEGHLCIDYSTPVSRCVRFTASVPLPGP